MRIFTLQKEYYIIMQFYQTAFAQTAEGTAQAAAQPGPIASLLPFILLIALFYFLFIRPNIKRQKEHKNLVDSLAVGDEVVTNNGMIGKVHEIQGNVTTIDFGSTKIKFQKHAIQTILPKGTVDGSPDSPSS